MKLFNPPLPNPPLDPPPNNLRTELGRTRFLEWGARPRSAHAGPKLFYLSYVIIYCRFLYVLYAYSYLNIILSLLVSLL